MGIKFSYNGVTSSACTNIYSGNQADTQAAYLAAIEALTGTGTAASVTMSNADFNQATDTDVEITFQSPLVGIAIKELDVSTAGCTAPTAGGNALDSFAVGIVHTGSHALGGTFDLTLDTSSCTTCVRQATEVASGINFAGSAATVESALNALPNSGNGFTVTKTASSDAQFQHWSVTFQGGWIRGNGPEISVTNIGTLTGDNPGSTVTTPVSGATTTGAFRLSYGEGEITQDISADASALEMQTAVESLPSIHAVNVERSWSKEIIISSDNTFSVHHGTSTVLTSADMRGVLNSGDLISIGGFDFRVSPTATFSATEFGLSEVHSDADKVFPGATSTVAVGYKWSGGYEWVITLHNVAGNRKAFTHPLHSLGPDGAGLEIIGGAPYMLPETYYRAHGCERCFYVDGLTMGNGYHLRFSAHNAEGYSDVAGSQSIQAIPMRVANAPTSVKLYVVSGQELEVFFEPPTSNGGSVISKYQVEWDTVETFNSADLATAVVEGGAIAGTPPFTYLISGLTSGIPYFVRVRAENAVAYQDLGGNVFNYNYERSTPLSAVPVNNKAGAPVAVSIALGSDGTSLRTFITQPSRNGGAAVTKYLVEWDVQSTFNSGTGARAGMSLGAAEPLVSTLSQRQLVNSVGPYVYDIDGLSSGVSYYVRVSAYNDEGYGEAKLSSPSFLIPRKSPDAPQDLATSTKLVQVFPIDDIDVSWSLPENDGGNAITSHKVEWFAKDKNIPEVQTVKLTGADGGNFALNYDGVAISGIPFDATAVDLRFALMTVNSGNTISHVEVTRTLFTSGFEWDITFTGNPGDRPPIVPDASALTSSFGGTPSVTVQETLKGRRANGNSEVQRTRTSSTASISGYWRLAFAGSGYTAYLPFDASNADVENALESLPTVGLVTVTRSGDGTAGSCVGECPYGYQWLVQFDTLVGDAVKMSADSFYLVGDSNAAATVTVEDGDNSVDQSTAARLCDQCVVGETPQEYAFQILDVATLSYRITGLHTGRAYTVRLSSANDKGFGPLATVPATIPPKQLPGIPTNLTLAPKTGDSTKILVRYDAPTSDGGDEVLLYKVEFDTSSSFTSAAQKLVKCPNHNTRKVFTITTNSVTTPSTAIGGGHFQLDFTKGGVTEKTPKILWNAEAMASDEAISGAVIPAEGTRGGVYVQSRTTSPPPTTSSGSLQSVLQDLPNFGGKVNVVRTSHPTGIGSFTWTVTFLGDGDDFQLTFANDAGVKLVDGGGSDINSIPSTEDVTITTLVQGEAFLACTGRDIELTGLVQGTPYFVRVFSYNSLGFSSAKTSPTSQKPMQPPGAATAATVSVLSGSSLRVMWSPPADNGGDDVTKYRIEWSIYSNFSSSNTHDVLYLAGGAPFTYSITNLPMGVSQYVRVFSFHSQGFGSAQATSPSSEYPRQVPTTPTSVRLGVTSGTKLTVSFATPSNIGGDKVTKYLVEWDRSSSFASLLSAPHKGSVELYGSQNHSYTINNLASQQIYYVRVSASNAVGYGPVQTASPPFAAPFNVLPGKISSATIVPTTSSSLTVAWNPPLVPDHGIFCSGGGEESQFAAPNLCPSGMGYGTDADGGSQILKYIIEWDASPTFNSGNAALRGTLDFFNVGIRPYSTVISGLTCTHSAGAGSESIETYYIRIFAYNAVGQGAQCGQEGALCDGSVLSTKLTCA